MSKTNETEPNQFSRRARKLLGKATKAGFDPTTLRGIASSAIHDARLQERGQATQIDIRFRLGAELNRRTTNLTDSGQPSLRSFDFTMRVFEASEMFTEAEARTYINSCDYPESVDDLLLADEIQRRFGLTRIRNMSILDAMCGPGRLGREFLDLGTPNVTFHDGDKTMTNHARNQAAIFAELGQDVAVVTSPVDRIPLPDNRFDLYDILNQK